MKKARTFRPDNDSKVNGELHGDRLLEADRLATAWPGGVIWISYVIKQIIASNNLDRAVSRPHRCQCHQRRNMPKRLDKTPSCCHFVLAWTLPIKKKQNDKCAGRACALKFGASDYDQEEDAKPQPPWPRKKTRLRLNLSINAEADVDRDAISDEGIDEENDVFVVFLVADDVQFQIIDHISQFIK